MARLAVLMLWEASHLLPTFKLSQELRQAGHRVTYFTIPDLLGVPRSRGFEAVPILADAFPPNTHGRWQCLPAQQRRRAQASFMNALRMQHVEAAIAALGPDLVLADSLFHATFAVTLRRRGVPVLYLSTSLPNEWRGGLPPLTAHALPGRSLLKRLEAELLWTRAWAKSQLDYLFRSDFMLPPRLYKSGYPEIVLCPAEFDFPRPRPAERHYVGPSIEADRPAEDFPWHALSESGRLIYCSFGTQAHRYTGVAQFLSQLIRAVCPSSGEQLVISADRETLDCLGPLPPHVIGVEKSPQLDLLKRTCVAITHGGLGTIKECIFHGVPMMVVPKAFDQAGNAARVELHGLGVRILTVADQSRIRQSLDRILHGQTFKENVRRMQHVFRQAQAENLGARVIDNHLRRFGQRRHLDKCNDARVIAPH